MTMTDATDFIVRRDNLRQTDFAATTIPSPKNGQVVIAVDTFAFTANNVTYAVFGDAMQYWDFYPAPPPWGRIPVWGFADVVESRCAGIAPGERLFGYWPMSTHTVLEPTHVTASSFNEAAVHRQHLHTLYNQYTRTTGDPGYDRSREDLQMLLRVLFLTGFLIDDFLHDNGFFGARSAVITSASSKTAMSLAFQLRQNRRGACEVIGLTSTSHVPFVESLGCYDNVVAYDRIDSLPSTVPTVLVDMAGDGHVLRALHAHFGASLKYSCMVGGTHWDRIAIGQELEGVQPVLFFAPAQVAKRNHDWGQAKLQQEMAQAWLAFTEPASRWIHVVRSRGPAAVRRVYLDVLEGRVNPADGHVLTLRD